MNLLLESLQQLFLQQPVAQTLGLIALSIGLSGFAQKQDHRLKIMLSLFNVIMGVHFLMMGSYPGAVSAWIGSLRTWVSNRTRSWKWMLLFMATTVILTVLKINSWILCLPLLGSLLGTWGMFREQGIRLRVVMFLGSICWLAHNVMIHSIGGSIIELSFLVMNSLTLWRLGMEQKRLSEKGTIV